MGTRNISWG